MKARFDTDEVYDGDEFVGYVGLDRMYPPGERAVTAVFGTRSGAWSALIRIYGSEKVEALS